MIVVIFWSFDWPFVKFIRLMNINRDICISVWLYRYVDFLMHLMPFEGYWFPCKIAFCLILHSPKENTFKIPLLSLTFFNIIMPSSIQLINRRVFPSNLMYLLHHMGWFSIRVASGGSTWPSLRAGLQFLVMVMCRSVGKPIQSLLTLLHCIG